MRVDHGGADIGMTKQLLHGADVGVVHPDVVLSQKRPAQPLHLSIILQPGQPPFRDRKKHARP